MHIRIYFKQEGSHVHCRVFTAKAKNLTFAKNGTLIFTVEEWPAIHKVLSGIAEVLAQ